MNTRGSTNTWLTLLILAAIAGGGYAGYALLDSEDPTDYIILPEGESLTETTLVIATWNVRGYPEKAGDDSEEAVARRTWFTDQLTRLAPHVICIQEIANQERVNTFTANEAAYVKVAFTDSSDGQDNAIFCTETVELNDKPDPEGFQHPIQVAFIAHGGFDAVIATVHLSWTDVEKREQEKQLLKDVVATLLQIDPDVIIAGDFNTQGQDILDLANEIGLIVMIPEDQEGVGTTHAGNRYDHFLISPDLANEEAIECKIVTFRINDKVPIITGGSRMNVDMAKKVSDHLPVIARFRVNEEFKDRE